MPMSRCSVQRAEGGTLLIRSAVKSWADQRTRALGRTDGHSERRRGTTARQNGPLLTTMAAYAALGRLGSCIAVRFCDL